jgi:hypothetical protein
MRPAGFQRRSSAVPALFLIVVTGTAVYRRGGVKVVNGKPAVSA